jgi:hypothetical protein
MQRHPGPASTRSNPECEYYLAKFVPTFCANHLNNFLVPRPALWRRESREKLGLDPRWGAMAGWARN